MRSKDGSWKLFHRYIADKKTSLGIPYLDRLYLIECPWFSIMSQYIGGPDPDTYYHNHPWTFFSFILYGKYIEASPGKRQGDMASYEIVKTLRTWWNFKRAEDFHTILDTYQEPVLSLLFCGPRRQDWGFLVEGDWVSFRDYFARKGEMN